MADIDDDTLNTTLYDEDGNVVKVFLNATGNRLGVDATISGDESPTKYSLRFDIDPVGVSVGLTDTRIHYYEGTPGILDFVALGTNIQTYEAIIKIDGIEQFRASMGDLGDLGLANATNVPYWAENANKNFRLHPNTGFGFENSFEVLARSTVGTKTILHTTLWREKV
jgi:hypothetical protein